MDNVHIGMSGWSYHDWKGLFYPSDLKSTEWLKFYAKHFSTVEINCSFYNLPKASWILSWAEKTPEGFTFCPKLSRYITHIKRLNECEEPLQRFFSLFEPMRPKLGPVLIQLPPSLKFDYDTTEAFFALLKEDYRDYTFVMEPRHDTWLMEDAFNLLAKYDVAWVVSQSGVGFPYSENVTAKNIYIRFHGPKKLYASLYTEAHLQEYAVKIKAWAEAGHIVWIFFNNTSAGLGLENSKQLEEMLRPSNWFELLESTIDVD